MAARGGSDFHADRHLARWLLQQLFEAIEAPCFLERVGLLVGDRLDGLSDHIDGSIFERG
jgi:hypothetical protein